MNKLRLATGIVVLVVVYGLDDVVEKLTHQAWPLEFFALAGAIYLFWLIAKGWGTKATHEQRTARLGFRRILGTLASFFYNSSDTCRRCHTPLGMTKAHTLHVPGLFGQEHNTVVAICEWCHSDTTPDERVEFYGAYYMRLVSRGVQPQYANGNCGASIDWTAIVNAIQAEQQLPQQSAESAT